MDFIVQNAIKNTESKAEEFDLEGQANIKVIGGGGAGNKMVSWLYR